MASSADAEANAFLAWVQAVLHDSPNASRHIETVDDLCDGVALFDLLADIDEHLFRNPHGADTKGNWVLTIGTLKRLYKHMMQYYSESLQCSPQPLPTPDLNAIARSSDKQELNKLCLLAIGIAVQSEKNDLHIAAIQTLSEADQHQLMMAIENIMASITAGQDDRQDDGQEGSTDEANGDHTHQQSNEALTADLAKAQKERDEIEKAYLQLLEDHKTLQTTLDDTTSEAKDVSSQFEAYKRSVEESRNEQADVIMRQEIERLKVDLRRSEDNLAEAENDNEKLIASNEEMKRKMEDLQKKADEGAKLKDQMEEYKHAADKLSKAENVIEKYKKKLEEGADIRRQLKSLEDQNAELVDRNAALEDQYKHVSQFKPLMDSYKSQIADLESKTSDLRRDLGTANYEKEQILSRFNASEEQRAKEKEEMELYQERIRELELGGEADPTKRRKKLVSRKSDVAVNGAEGLAAADETTAAHDADDLDDELDTTGELEDALSGTTMTDLKIKVRKLTRELDEARTNKADQSRLIVLENLLEDAQRMKSRYEADYLREHREKMVLQSEIETIRSGKSDLGDGTEAAYALRLRLNQVVDELDKTKLKLNALQVQHEQITKELTVARSDFTLVNKDQVDILHSLRASIEVEKDELESTIKRLKNELNSANEQNRMYMAQVNSLLMEKVDLQTEGIGQRDEALKRERALGELKAKLSGKALPKEVEDLVTNLQSEAMDAQKELKAISDKFGKAKLFIKQQDRMLKDKERAASVVPKALPTDEETEKINKRLKEEVRNLRMEQRLMMSAFQDLGRRYMVELESSRNPSGGSAMMMRGSAQSTGSGSRSFSGGLAAINGGAGSNSWLSKQRRLVNPTLQVAGRR